jgi:ribosome recycling factor
MNGKENILNTTEEKMKKTIETMKKEFVKIRTGRASASLIEDIKVDAYGSKMPLNQLSTITVPESNLILVQVWDKSLVQTIDKAIREAGLGFNPIVEGNFLKIPVPPLTEERRREIVKGLKKRTEEFRMAIRNIRRDANDTVKKWQKNGEVSEDDMHRLLQKIQELTDKYIKEIDEAFSKKEKEVMGV